ncbi:hypothetical protein T439DRAFT_321362 [Meredithblackwellia eburnea MCA 4105]
MSYHPLPTEAQFSSLDLESQTTISKNESTSASSKPARPRPTRGGGSKSRRPLSKILFPPQLSSLPIVDPFAPPAYREEEEEELYSSESDEGDERERDKHDEKALMHEMEGLALGQDEEEGDQNNFWYLRGAYSRRRRVLLTLIPGGIIFVLLFTFLASHLFSGKHTFHGQGLSPITFEHIKNGTFAVERVSLDWLAEAGDGVFSYRTDEGDIILQDVSKNTTSVLVKGANVKDEFGAQLDWWNFKVSADLKYIIFDAEWTKQWRHSSHANFYIYSMATAQTFPLRQPEYPPKIAIAAFSPVDHKIAYVHSNDLYILEQPPISRDGIKPIRVTEDGSATTFNGVPDWVYEEEVFSSDSALWWSPSGDKLAFLSFDEHDVPEYEFPVYNPTNGPDGTKSYPEKVVMRYPKPGFPNPKVKLRVFDLNKLDSLVSSQFRPGTQDPRVVASTFELVLEKPFAPADTIITEVTWVGSSDLIVKATNRIATIQRVAHFVLSNQLEEEGEMTVIGKIVRDDDTMGEGGDGGWIEQGQPVVGIEATTLLHSSKLAHSLPDPAPEYPSGYLDVVPNKEGFNHLAYFSPPESSDPVFLTSGAWEVDSVSAVDISRGLIYLVVANPSIERHLYSVPLPTVSDFAKLEKGKEGKVSPPLPTALTDVKKMGYHRVSFSPYGGFYVLNFEGPTTPWQKLVKVDDKNFDKVMVTNDKLIEADRKFMKVNIVYTTVVADGIELNAVEMYPPDMDTSGRTKYPILISVYGGPASQKVQTLYQRDWHYFLVTSLNYIVVFVDPRGTGYKGRSFRMPIRDRLGALEARDTVEAARHYSNLPYVDERRVGIWGWSYGGYLTSKVVETNSSVYTLAVAVAPVTDWRYYDTIYTERYMSTPDINLQGYVNSSVHDMAGFHNIDFLLAHGSGDDNVHYLNTAALLDRLTIDHVRNFRFRMFTDSDHSMGKRGAYWELMQYITDFLVEKWGDGGRTKTKWKMTAHQVERFREKEREREGK